MCTTLCAAVADYCKGDDISDADCNKKCEAMIPRENCPPLCTNVMAICNASESEPEMGEVTGEDGVERICGSCFFWEVAVSESVLRWRCPGLPGGTHTHTH